jgi:putative nucleotidyltransferase with HDIG domain
LAIYKRITNPEIYFTAGLLHDIGKLILLSYSPDEYTEVVRLIEANGRMGYECEKEVFGFTHGEVGAELCRQWNHPESLLEAVAYHHEPVKLAEHSDLTAVTHVADIITHACQFGNSGDPFVPVLDPSAWDAIGLSTGILKPTVEKVHEQIEEITDALLSDQF